MAIEARHVRVRGHVQGVAFRHHTKVRARELGLAGWVQNLPDGSVEVWIEGERDSVSALIEFLRAGQPPARVESVDVRIVTPEEDGGGFRVVGA